MATLLDVISLVNEQTTLYSNLLLFTENPVYGDKIKIGEKTYTFGSNIEIKNTLDETLAEVKRVIPEAHAVKDDMVVLTSYTSVPVSVDVPARKAGMSLILKKNFKPGDSIQLANVTFHFQIVAPFPVAGEPEISPNMVPLFDNVEATLKSLADTIQKYQKSVSNALINQITVTYVNEGLLIEANEVGSAGNGIKLVYGSYTFETKNGSNVDRIAVRADQMEEGGAGDLTPDLKNIVTEREIFENGIKALETIVCMLVEGSTSPLDSWSGARRDRKELKGRIKDILEVIPSAASDHKDDRKDISDKMKTRLL